MEDIRRIAMRIRLVIDGNSVYEVEEDWEEVGESRRIQEEQSGETMTGILPDKSSSERKGI